MRAQDAGAPPRSGLRRDIEGLRAVAVLLVIANHLLGDPVGGFVGVDVFFVVSGFLISSLLLDEAARSGRISIREFYARRMRRIMPAALLVLVATTVASYSIFTPGRAYDTLRDAGWAGLFLANVHFAQVGTDYFQQGVPPSAVQHYWSLSVEEQFYVVWPLTLLILFVLGTRVRRLRPGVLVGSVGVLAVGASFWWSLALTSSAPTDAYFSTPARAWEIGLGALLAVSRGRLTRIPAWARVGMAWVGLYGIGVAAVLVTADARFPGPWAALPVLATGLILAAGNPGGGPGARWALGNPVAQYIGRLSYSLYLWHWPCITLAAAYWGPHGFPYYVSAAIVPALLSVLSFHLIEDPIRRSSWLSARSADRPRPTFADWYHHNKRGLDIALVGTAATAFLIAGWVDLSRTSASQVLQSQRTPVATTTHGAELTGQPRAIAMALAATSWGHLDPSLDDLRKPPAGCTSVVPANVASCVYGDPAATKTAVVIGDSIAMAWTPAVVTALSGHGWRVQMLTLSECPAPDLPTWQNTLTRGRVYQACADHRAWVAQEIRSMQPDLVVASSLSDFANRIVGIDTTNDARNVRAWQNGTRDLVESLRVDARRVVVIGQPPNSANLQTCVTRRSTPADCITTVTTMGRAIARAERDAATAAGGVYVDPVDWFCYEGRCPAVVGNTPVMRDGTHITADYARELAPLLRPALLGQRSRR